jgi:hypothetical protein
MPDRRYRTSRSTNTTVGELVAVAYQVALAEVRDARTAQRIAAVVVEDLLSRKPR